METNKSSAPRSGPVPPNHELIEIDSDDGSNSDSTLVEDGLGERVPPVLQGSRRRPHKVRTKVASFRELQTHSQNGRSNHVGQTFRHQDGHLHRLVSIKQHLGSGHTALESVRVSHHRILQTHSFNGRTFRPGKTVEMVDGDFLRIKAILEDRRTGDIALEGFRFQRAISLDGLLEFKRNEVAMILKFDKNDSRPILEQSSEIIELAAVIRVRELVKTNQQFPALSYRDIDPKSQKFDRNFTYDHGRLVCRWNFLRVTQKEGFLRKMTAEESDDQCSIPEEQLRHNYRGPTTKGGDYPGRLATEEAFDLSQRMRCNFIDPLNFYSRPTNDHHNRRQQQTYTFGEGFCGCGGASRGAYGAGLRVAWGFDHDPYAIATYSTNFPYTRCEGIAANDFITALCEDYKVDILHLSPPCQPFSPAHTRPGSNDEINEASFLATEELLKKTKPRIVTLEETFGLNRTVHNLPWFNAMIQTFTKLGFSVRWKVFNLEDFGLPQPRKRLFLFASCPGETLPDFPNPTHCKAEDHHRFPHLRKVTTINDAISHIPRNFADHDPHRMIRLDRPPYSGDVPLRHTITCSGALSYHPSGKRAFTNRELACLQGFPLEHHFGKGARRHIGNAVPPIVAKVFFEQVVRALRRADGV